MGIDVTTTIWVGIKLEDEGYPSLPEEELEEFDETGELREGNLTFRDIKCSEMIVGFGVELFELDWRCRVKVINLESLLEETRNMIPQIQAAFKKWGIEEEPGTFVSTNLW